MSEAVTLADFLCPDAETLPMQLTAGIDGTPELSSAKTLLTSKLSGAQWSSMVHAMAGRMGELLRTPFTTILARAWKDLMEVREAMETTRHSPDRTEVVALADHSVESEHKPYLDVFENGKRIARITFAVSLEIELRGLLLTIEKGAIRKMDTGDVRIKGALKLGDFTILEKEFEPVRLPGEIQFAQTAN